jgi:hypothetical protein
MQYLLRVDKRALKSTLYMWPELIGSNATHRLGVFPRTESKFQQYSSHYIQHRLRSRVLPSLQVRHMRSFEHSTTQPCMLSTREKVPQMCKTSRALYRADELLRTSWRRKGESETYPGATPFMYLQVDFLAFMCSPIKPRLCR